MLKLIYLLIFKIKRFPLGYCFQFNKDGKFEANAAGLKGGVQFKLDALTHQYFIGPYSHSEGFLASI